MKDYLILILVVLCAIALPIISGLCSNISIFHTLDPLINKHILYQSITMLLTLSVLGLLRITKKETLFTYLKKGNISAKIKSAPLVGIKPKENENWKHLGLNFAFVITLVTSIVIYFQLLKGNEINYALALKVIPIALGFAIVNSFVEETITRLGVIVALKERLPDQYIMLASGLLFGTVHFWGNPGGVVGMLVAGFLGWFLAKSILETKGFFWAWFIHFMQDVVIYTAMFLTS